jgi:U4/U6 small nuclear ribonucleoprotein PRP3
MDERARKIAELQAQIQSKLASSSKLATLNLSLPKPAVGASKVTNGGAAAAAAVASAAAMMGVASNEPKPGPLILNAEGRTVDATGREVLLPQHKPTLKANIRALKREVLKTHMGRPGQQQQRDEAGSLIPESQFFDPRVPAKPAVRTRRGFHFHEQGKFQQVASRMRMKAQLDKLQSEISQIARKTGINSVTALALVAPRIGDRKGEEEVPELEWWDSVILQTRSYEVIFFSSV